MVLPSKALTSAERLGIYAHMYYARLLEILVAEYPTTRQILTMLSITDHFDDFARGIIDTKHLVYYVSFITFGLFLTSKSVDMERWKG